MSSDRFMEVGGWAVCVWCWDYLSNCTCTDQDRPSDEKLKTDMEHYESLCSQLARGT